MFGRASFKIRTSSLIIGILSSALSPSSSFKFESNSLNFVSNSEHWVMDASGEMVDAESLCLFDSFRLVFRALEIPSTTDEADEAAVSFSVSPSISLLFSAISSFAFLISPAGSKVAAADVVPDGPSLVGPGVASHWSSMVAASLSTAMKQNSSPSAPSLL